MQNLPSDEWSEAWERLDEACVAHDDEIFLSLVSQGLPSAGDRNGWRPLHYASFHGRHRLVSTLLAQGHDPSVLTHKNMTALHMAARGRSADCLGVLLDHGVNPDGVDRTGMTALHHVAWVGCERATRRLLAAGATRDPRDERTMTPLHLAARGDHGPVVWVLLEQGADPSLSESSGLDAFAIARHSHATSALAHLEPWAQLRWLEQAVRPATGVDRGVERL